MAYGEGSNAYFGGAEGRQYVSLSDEENYAEPFLALCLSPEEDQVREIVTGLSQKNYAEGPGQLFQEKTFYAMQALFPDLDRAGFDRFYQVVFSGGDYGAVGQEALPVRVFLQDGVACYGTLRIGECDQIHLRAADQALLDQWQAAGVEIVQGLP